MPQTSHSSLSVIATELTKKIYEDAQKLDQRNMGILWIKSVYVE